MPFGVRVFWLLYLISMVWLVFALSCGILSDNAAGTAGVARAVVTTTTGSKVLGDAVGSVLLWVLGGAATGGTAYAIKRTVKQRKLKRNLARSRYKR